MVNMETSKAMFECLRANRGSGELIWMTQSAWPDLICQLYDYYFEPTAAYFGAKEGAKPLHIFWDSNADIIKAANDTLNDESQLTAEARACDLDGKEMWHKSTPLDLSSASVKNCFAIQRPADPSAVFFIKLKLCRGKEVLDDNFYWSSCKNGSCTNLDRLPRVTLHAIADAVEDGQTARRPSVHVSNPRSTWR